MEEGEQHHGNSNTKSNILEIDNLVDVSNLSPEKMRLTSPFMGLVSFMILIWRLHFVKGPLKGPYVDRTAKASFDNGCVINFHHNF